MAAPGNGDLIPIYQTPASFTFNAVRNNQKAVTPFPYLFAQDIISDFKQNWFLKILSYLDACSSKIRLLKNPFDSVIENLPSDLHMEVIDLQSSGVFKNKFKEGNLIEFYKCLPY